MRIFSVPSILHPMARTFISKEELNNADIKIKERKENMKKFNIEE